MGIITWADETLCTDADCVNEETRVTRWNNGESLKRWRDLAKDKIGERLRHLFRQRTVDMDIDIETDDILNHIYSYEPMRTAAVYMSIHLMCKNSTVNPGDLYDQKSRDYWGLFTDEWPRAIEMLHMDIDQSGTIEDIEKFNVMRGITARRGG